MEQLLAGIHMKTTLIVSCISFCLLACGPRNKDFNPFDDEFRFHKYFTASNYDTIIGECGYWNLTNRNDGSYYQFYGGDPKIVAKGFDVYLNVVEVDTSETLSGEELTKIFDSHPVDLSELRNVLSKFNIADVRYVDGVFKDVIDIETGEDETDSLKMLVLFCKNDSTYLPHINGFIDGNMLVRRIGYFNARRQ